MDITLGMSFVILSNIEVNFINWEIKWTLYTITKTLFYYQLSKTSLKKKACSATFDVHNKTSFVIYVAILANSNLGPEINLFHIAQIASVKTDKISISVFLEYINLSNIFYKKLIAKILEYIKINNYRIQLLESQQVFYGSIYSLSPVKLETWKTYIKIYFTTDYIKLSKSIMGIFI